YHERYECTHAMLCFAIISLSNKHAPFTKQIYYTLFKKRYKNALKTLFVIKYIRITTIKAVSTIRIISPNDNYLYIYYYRLYLLECVTLQIIYPKNLYAAYLLMKSLNLFFLFLHNLSCTECDVVQKPHLLVHPHGMKI